MAISLLVVLLLCTVGINSQEKHPSQYWDDYVNSHLSKGVTKFAIDLNRALDAKQGGENVAFSPLNIVGLLAVLLLGSVGKSSETLSALGFDKDDVVSGDTEFLHQMFGNLINSIQSANDTAKVESINGIFVQKGYPIRPNFAAFARDVYKYDIRDVNFSQDPLAAKNIINNWIKSATHGKIDRLLEEPLDYMTKVFLASVLNFKADWKYPFSESSTQRRPFYLDSAEEVVEVDMMAHEGKFMYNAADGLEIVGLPYNMNADDKSQSTATMFLILPSHIKNTSTILSSLTPDYINSLISRMYQVDLLIRLPRMKISNEFSLHDTLPSLGFTTMFDPAEANFGLLSTGEAGPSSTNERLNFPKTKSDIKGGTNETSPKSPIPVDFEQYVNDKEFPSYGLDELRTSRNFSNPHLCANKGLHKVNIEITEKGTSATVISSTGPHYRSGNVPIFFNRPFLFFIKHYPSGLISLWGVVKKPTPFYKPTRDYRSDRRRPPMEDFIQMIYFKGYKRNKG